jgi:hypothetical protein
MGKAKRRKQLDPNYGKPKVIKSGVGITEETLKIVGAIQPPDKDLPPAIIFCIQFGNIHSYQQLFISSMQFLNRGLNICKFVFTQEQFDRVLQSLIEDKALIFKDGGYYHHPDIEKKIRKGN